MKSCLRAGVGTLLALTLIIAATINLESTPPLWWDEGWNLSVARNWVELGHYGRLLAGEPISPAMSTGFPAIAPVALSFRLLGVGIWQGRLIGVFFTFGALALIYYLATRLYNRPVAIATLAVLLLMSPHFRIHPILMGRQVLGEMPALFYLLAGYACFLSALHRPLWFMPLATVFWGISLNTKAQVLPFWTVSLLIPSLIALFKRRWRFAGPLVVGLLGSFAVSRLLLLLQQLVLRDYTTPRTPIYGLYDVTALVPIFRNRVLALTAVLMFGLPLLLGLCYGAWKLIRDRDRAVLNLDSEIVRQALLVLAGSWFVWYVCLSNGVPRYLFPSVFVGSIFVAALLYDLTDRFSLTFIIKHGGFALRHLRFNQQSAGALVATVLIALTFPTTMRILYRSYFTNADTSSLQAANFLNTQTATGALIETYDSELFFLLDRRYHYPPDQISIELIRRTLLGQDAAVAYDPLAADPDYLVVGPFSRIWQLYDPVLATGAFRLIRTYSRYKVYERIR